MADLFTETYNPDVLSCLANLSNDEVFTPPEVANQVLDMLPDEIWEDPDATFLDPACKSGIFLREIAKRLIAGLEDKIPDLDERLEHIYKKQLFGIATTELCSLLSRRSLYCSKYPNSKYSVVSFDNAEGNVRYRRTHHTWKNGKCVWCGAAKVNYDRDESLEQHAYEFIHPTNLEEIKDMKFDVIVGNPPYQLSDGGNKASAMPIYQKFVEQSISLDPKYLIMIIPARWYSGGKGLDGFRQRMLTDKHLVKLVDYVDSKDCFPGVDIAGGICYFLWDRDNVKDWCVVDTHRRGEVIQSERRLDEFSTFIRDPEALSIIHKVISHNEPTMDEQISSRKPFGLATNVKPLEEGDILLRHIRGVGPYMRNLVTTGQGLIDKWKVVASYVSFDHAGRADKDGKKKVLSKMRILPPGTICTETYLVYGAYDSKGEAENLRQYMSCKLPRFLIAQLMSGQHLTKQKFALCPIPDVTESVTDSQLYRRYGLSEEEIDFVESSIREIESEDGE